MNDHDLLTGISALIIAIPVTALVVYQAAKQNLKEELRRALIAGADIQKLLNLKGSR